MGEGTAPDDPTLGLTRVKVKTDGDATRSGASTTSALPLSAPEVDLRTQQRSSGQILGNDNVAGLSVGTRDWHRHSMKIAPFIARSITNGAVKRKLRRCARYGSRSQECDAAA